MSNQIGDPVYGSNKKKQFKIKEGDNVYRILPPFGSYAGEGKWSVFEIIHWGYKGSGGFRSFNCILRKDSKTKMVKQPCPECDKIAEQLKLKETKLAQLKEKKVSDADAKEFVQPITDWLFSHNRDSKWYLNVMNKDGEIGRLAIPHKMYTALQAVLNDLIKKGFNPCGIEKGVWLNFHRTGTFSNTVHTVKVVTEVKTIDGEEFQKIKVHNLTPEDLKRMQQEAWDLKGMFRTITFEEVQRLVSSGGDKDVVDTIFGSPERRKAEEAAPTGGEEEPEPGSTSTASSNAVGGLLEQAAADENPLDPVEAALLAKLQKKAAAKGGSSTKTMSNEEFAKTFGE